MGKIELSEEEAREFLNLVLLKSHPVGFSETRIDVDYDETIEVFKRHGYIKKSELEKAREKYLRFSENNIIAGDILVYMIELEREIEGLKNENK